jgi:hypothetical protein
LFQLQEKLPERGIHQWVRRVAQIEARGRPRLIAQLGTTAEERQQPQAAQVRVRSARKVFRARCEIVVTVAPGGGRLASLRGMLSQ